MSGRVEGDRYSSDWNEMFSQLSQGHEHIYANELGEVRVFASSNEARASQFSHRLSLSKVIELMMTKLNNCSNDQELEVINRNLHLLIEKKRFKIGHPSAKEVTLRLIYRSRLEEQQTRVERSKESALPHLDIITDEVAGELIDHLGRSTSLVRSLHGLGGVYFVQVLSDDTTYILKSMPDPLYSVIADRFYHQFGFEVPEYSPVYSGSSLGKQIQTIIDQNKLHIIDPRKAQSNQEVDRSTFFAGVEKHRYITAMKMIKGTPFNQLSVDDAIKHLQDEKILQAIGRMVFLDAVIGNGDRFCMKMNLGNILLLPEAERRKEGEMPIALIDHVYNNRDRASAKIILRNLKDYQEGRLFKEQVFLFVKYLIKNDLNAEQLSLKIYPHIRAGFDEAREEFIQRFSNKNEVSELFDIEGVASQSKPDPTLFLNLIESISHEDFRKITA